jgi:hypothetical protein
MIQAELEFPTSAKRRIISTFLELPGTLRPTHESIGEDEEGSPIVDRGAFLGTAMRRETGFFLRGSRVLYDIGVAGPTSIVCRGFLEISPGLAKDLMIHMAGAQPIFGFACAPEERKARNRVTTRQGMNVIESWIGRDPQKYVPGLYWLTLLPAALAERHGVPLAVIQEIALEHLELSSGQHLFRFYEHPDDWRATSRVTEVCASLPGVFDIEKVRPLLSAAKNFLDLDELWRVWR